jgi:hypothetical protein
MIAYRTQIPTAESRFVARLCAELNLYSTPIVLNVMPSPNDQVSECFHNVQRRVEQEGGKSVLGWQFWESPFMIQAEFHAVWRKADGSLVDITPKDDKGIHQILFVEDKVRKYDGTQTDNLRINTTDCGLIDDLIKVMKAQHRFLNKDGRENVTGVVNLKDEDAQIWYSMKKLSDMLEHLHLSGGDINFPCFCGSGVAYLNCHREIVHKAMGEI